MNDMTPFEKDLEGLLEKTGIPHCYQCGRCTSACPSALVNQTFNPRRFILDLLNGYEENILNEGVIWMCVACHSCEEACPKHVRITSILNVLRAREYRAGNAPRAYLTNAELFLRSGLVAVISGTNRTRKQVGLDGMPTPDIDQIKKLLKGTRLTTSDDGKPGGQG